MPQFNANEHGDQGPTTAQRRERLTEHGPERLHGVGGDHRVAGRGRRRVSGSPSATGPKSASTQHHTLPASASGRRLAEAPGPPVEHPVPVDTSLHPTPPRRRGGRTASPNASPGPCPAENDDTTRLDRLPYRRP